VVLHLQGAVGDAANAGQALFGLWRSSMSLPPSWLAEIMRAVRAFWEVYSPRHAGECPRQPPPDREAQGHHQRIAQQLPTHSRHRQTPPNGRERVPASPQSVSPPAGS